jgi:phosphatidylserine/phosphatidylglycerophosphate/cardiolipin synthase-like enzyme
MRIDGTVVITGSFNFTKAAQDRNAENLRVLEDPALVVEYRANWEGHWNRRPMRARPPAATVEAE